MATKKRRRPPVDTKVISERMRELGLRSSAGRPRDERGHFMKPTPPPAPKGRTEGPTVDPPTPATPPTEEEAYLEPHPTPRRSAWPFRR